MDDDDRVWKLQLYVAGDTPQSRKAVSDLNEIIKTYGSKQTEIAVIDLFDNPEMAVENDILAIPTLIRELPAPALRIIGDLSSRERVWSALNG